MKNQQRRLIQNIAGSLKSRRWLLGSVVAAGFIGMAGIAVWAAGWSRDDFLEPACTPPVSSAPQTGCVATVPIKDVNVGHSSTIGLSRDGTRLLLGGALPHDETKLVLQALDVAERREVWRVPVEGLGFYLKLAVSGKDDRVAVWGSEPPIRIVDMQRGKTVVELPNKGPHTDPFFDAAFSEDGTAIVTGDANQRRILTISDPTSEPAMASGFGDTGGCQAVGFVGQSNSGYNRSRDGSTAVLSASATASPIRAGKLNPSERLARSICGTRHVVLLDAPAGWSNAEEIFTSFSPDNGRLAVIYADRAPGRQTRTLIEVWRMSADMVPNRLAAFPMHGDVDYRIAWSADGRQLAAIRSNAEGTEARLYAIP
jgi:hypothetical protein